MVAWGRLGNASLSWSNRRKSSWNEAGANLGPEMFAFAAWANDLALGLGLEVVVAAAAGFEAALAVTALGAGGALETSGILFLELVGGGEDALAFPLPFLLVTRVKATSSTSSTAYSIWVFEVQEIMEPKERIS